MNEPSQITTLTNALMKSAASGERQQTANALLDLLWHVAELRSDMPNFLIWLGDDSGPISGQSYSGRIGKAVLDDDQQQMAQLIEALVSGSVIPFLPKDDLTEIESKLAGLMQGASTSSHLSVLTQFCTLVGRIAAAKQKSGRLTIHVEGEGDAEDDSFESLRMGIHTCISFRRTLRVPEDGKEYPLPADLGALPIYRIEDFAENVPAHWLEEGGFFIPLYQREALFIEFKGAKWRPSIAKVAVGRINAITGKPYDEKIHTHEQDYVVIPSQRWLDGINKGKDVVRQFVAMPLGQGYTIEEQLTDEARYGGFQLVVFDPKEDRFPSEDPEVTKRRKEEAAERRVQAKQDIFISRLNFESRTLATIFQEGDAHMAIKLGMSPEEQASKLRKIRDSLVQGLGDDGQALQRGKWSDDQIHSFIASQERLIQIESKRGSGRVQSNRHEDSERVRFMSAPLCCPPSALNLEMGIAAGGSIKQQIQRDSFGSDTWDQGEKRMVNIRIVNSAAFQKITGKPPPETPVTLETYQANRMPWFDSYDEAVESVTPARKFSFLKTVAAIARLRGMDISDDHTSIEVDADLVERIQTPTHEERVRTFLERAEVSIRAKRFTTAMREATLALNLVQGQSFWRWATHDDHAAFRRNALGLRARCYIQLQRFREAEEDVTEALEIPPQDDCLAFVIRAEAYLGLREYDLAAQDATSAIDIDPDYPDAYALRAEAHLRSDHDDDALQDSERALAENPRHSRALIVRGEIRMMNGSLGDAVSDLTRAMLISGPDPVALCARAKAFVQLGDSDQARADLHSALLIDPNFGPAIEHLQFMP
jgi:tetratricopeptide (TPR) repeat protein